MATKANKAKKVVKSALVVRPSCAAADTARIQTIRCRHDKAYVRWMPHINILYPFVPREEFDAAAPLLQEAVQPLLPFKVSLATFAYFKHGKTCTVYLKPDKESEVLLKNLQAACLEAFPFCNDVSKRASGYQPHLTVAQFRGDGSRSAEEVAQGAMESWQSSWSAITFTVEHVHLISRRDNEDPFHIRMSIPAVAVEKKDREHKEPQRAAAVKQAENAVATMVYPMWPHLAAFLGNSQPSKESPAVAPAVLVNTNVKFAGYHNQHVTFVVDCSSSMKQTLNILPEAIQRVLRFFKEQQIRVSLVLFHSSVYVLDMAKQARTKVMKCAARTTKLFHEEWIKDVAFDGHLAQYVTSEECIQWVTRTVQRTIQENGCTWLAPTLARVCSRVARTVEQNHGLYTDVVLISDGGEYYGAADAWRSAAEVCKMISTHYGDAHIHAIALGNGVEMDALYNISQFGNGTCVYAHEAQELGAAVAQVMMALACTSHSLQATHAGNDTALSAAQKKRNDELLQAQLWSSSRCFPKGTRSVQGRVAHWRAGSVTVVADALNTHAEEHTRAVKPHQDPTVREIRVDRVLQVHKARAPGGPVADIDPRDQPSPETQAFVVAVMCAHRLTKCLLVMTGFKGRPLTVKELDRVSSLLDMMNGEYKRLSSLVRERRLGADVVESKEPKSVFSVDPQVAAQRSSEVGTLNLLRTVADIAFVIINRTGVVEHQEALWKSLCCKVINATRFPLLEQSKPPAQVVRLLDELHYSEALRQAREKFYATRDSWIDEDEARERYLDMFSGEVEVVGLPVAKKINSLKDVRAAVFGSFWGRAAAGTPCQVDHTALVSERGMNTLLQRGSAKLAHADIQADDADLAQFGQRKSRQRKVVAKLKQMAASRVARVGHMACSHVLPIAVLPVEAENVYWMEMYKKALSKFQHATEDMWTSPYLVLQVFTQFIADHVLEFIRPGNEPQDAAVMSLADVYRTAKWTADKDKINEILKQIMYARARSKNSASRWVPIMVVKLLQDKSAFNPAKHAGWDVLVWEQVRRSLKYSAVTTGDVARLIRGSSPSRFLSRALPVVRSAVRVVKALKVLEDADKLLVTEVPLSDASLKSMKRQWMCLSDAEEKKSEEEEKKSAQPATSDTSISPGRAIVDELASIGVQSSVTRVLERLLVVCATSNESDLKAITKGNFRSFIQSTKQQASEWHANHTKTFERVRALLASVPPTSIHLQPANNVATGAADVKEAKENDAMAVPVLSAVVSRVAQKLQFPADFNMMAQIWAECPQYQGAVLAVLSAIIRDRGFELHPMSSVFAKALNPLQQASSDLVENFRRLPDFAAFSRTAAAQRQAQEEESRRRAQELLANMGDTLDKMDLQGFCKGTSTYFQSRQVFNYERGQAPAVAACGTLLVPGKLLKPSSSIAKLHRKVAHVFAHMPKAGNFMLDAQVPWEWGNSALLEPFVALLFKLKVLIITDQASGRRRGDYSVRLCVLPEQFSLSS